VGSDPGVSSLVTPMCKTDGMYFDSKTEPEEFKDLFEAEIYKYRKDREQGLFIDYKDGVDPEEFYNYYRSLMDKSSISEVENLNTKYCYIKYIMPTLETEEF
jgi:hypothetical protein